MKVTFRFAETCTHTKRYVLIPIMWPEDTYVCYNRFFFLRTPLILLPQEVKSSKRNQLQIELIAEKRQKRIRFCLLSPFLYLLLTQVVYIQCVYCESEWV